MYKQPNLCISRTPNILPLNSGKKSAAYIQTMTVEAYYGWISDVEQMPDKDWSQQLAQAS
jgi:hypothetical protein